jgi:hypothetical protein
MQKRAKGMKQQRVRQSDESVHQWIDGFVDDTSVFCNKEINIDNISELAKQLQHDAETWANLLAASGGKLELEKCFYYLLTWKFDEDGNAHPETMAEQQGRHTAIEITDEHTQEKLTIKQKEITAPHKTLGIMKTISGCEQAQTEFLRTKSNKFAAKLSHAKLNRHLAMKAYRSMYVPSITYGLPATNLSEKDMNNIQGKATQACLSA